MMLVVVTFISVALFVGWLAWRISGEYTAHPDIEELINEFKSPSQPNAVPEFLAELRGWLIAHDDPRIHHTAHGWEIDNVTQAAADFSVYQAAMKAEEDRQYLRRAGWRSVH